MEHLKIMKKKELRAEIERLHEEYLDAKMSYEWWHDEAVRLKSARTTDAKTISELRIENERLVLTPEAKVDTEAAFQRGLQAARPALRQYLLSAEQLLEEHFNPTYMYASTETLFKDVPMNTGLDGELLS